MVSQIIRLKISLANKGKNNGMYGKTHTAEVRKKIALAGMGRKPWNKGLHTGICPTKGKIMLSHKIYACINCAEKRGKSKYQLCKKCYWKKWYQEHQESIIEIRRQSLIKRGRHPHQLLRLTPEYREWRKTIYKRDNYKCVLCGSRERLAADHVKSFLLYPELRFELSNGRLLCFECHKKTDTFGRKIYATS